MKADMNNSNLRWLSLVGLLFLCSLATAYYGQQGNVGVSPYYQLPLIPIKVSYDIVTRKLQVSISGTSQTPIGTFGLTASAGSSPSQFGGVRTLTIETRTGKSIYQLERGRRYSISLPSDENGEARVIYSGIDDNLSIFIPNPTTETVGELRGRLNEALDAQRREEALDVQRRAQEARPREQESQWQNGEQAARRGAEEAECRQCEAEGRRRRCEVLQSLGLCTAREVQRR